MTDHPTNPPTTAELAAAILADHFTELAARQKLLAPTASTEPRTTAELGADALAQLFAALDESNERN